MINTAGAWFLEPVVSLDTKRERNVGAADKITSDQSKQGNFVVWM